MWERKCRQQVSRLQNVLASFHLWFHHLPSPFIFSTLCLQEKIRHGPETSSIFSCPLYTFSYQWFSKWGAMTHSISITGELVPDLLHQKLPMWAQKPCWGFWCQFKLANCWSTHTPSLLFSCYSTEVASSTIWAQDPIQLPVPIALCIAPFYGDFFHYHLCKLSSPPGFKT